MLGYMIPAVSENVSIQMVRMNLSPKVVAEKANVGVRFVLNMTDVGFREWRKHKVQRKLLRVLRVLEMRMQAEQVQELIKKSFERKMKRVKFDRRRGRYGQTVTRTRR